MTANKKFETRAAKMRVLPSFKKDALRSDQEPIVTGIKWIKPDGQAWRLSVEVAYQDGTVAFVPLAEFTSQAGGGGRYWWVLPEKFMSQPNYCCGAQHCDDPACGTHGANWEEWRKDS